MLIGMDEYPYHQITSTFAGVAGTDPAWNDGHYICLSDMAGQIGLASSLRLYQNNDVLDGFVCVRSAASSTTSGSPGGCGPTWTRWPWGRCGWRSSSR